MRKKYDWLKTFSFEWNVSESHLFQNLLNLHHNCHVKSVIAECFNEFFLENFFLIHISNGSNV